MLQMKPLESAHERIRKLGVTHSTVWRVLLEQQLYPRHLQQVEVLSL